MKKLLLKISLLAAAFTSLSASAATYNFSYTFDDSTPITGYLSGDLIGSFIENVSDVHVFFNGAEFSGPLYTAAWNTTTHNWDNTVGAKVSTDAALNNFVFADSNIPADYNASNYFYFVNDTSNAGPGHEVFAVNYNTGSVALDNPSNASWNLVAAPVPEPETYAMMLAGLGLLGVAARRRQR